MPETILLINTALLVLVIILLRKKSDKRNNHVVAANYLLDTSAIIDGRILEVARAGFTPGVLMVPKFVLAELQHIADSDNELRRQRGRYGLELVRQLQDLKTLKVKVVNDDPAKVDKVDDKLVSLGKRFGAMIVTTDFNLNKVATIQQVTVLNVNELAQGLRPVVLPGEVITVKLVQKGSDKGQAVGYLDDGTMVVVERSVRRIGQTVEVEISRIMQTVAGKMMFARLIKKQS